MLGVDPGPSPCGGPAQASKRWLERPRDVKQRQHSPGSGNRATGQQENMAGQRRKAQRGSGAWRCAGRRRQSGSRWGDNARHTLGVGNTIRFYQASPPRTPVRTSSTLSRSKLRFRQHRGEFQIGGILTQNWAGSCSVWAWGRKITCRVAELQKALGRAAQALCLPFGPNQSRSFSQVLGRLGSGIDAGARG